MGLPLSLLQMDEAPGSFSALTGPSLFADSPEVFAVPQLLASSSSRTHLFSMLPTSNIRTPQSQTCTTTVAAASVPLIAT